METTSTTTRTIYVHLLTRDTAYTTYKVQVHCITYIIRQAAMSTVLANLICQLSRVFPLHQAELQQSIREEAQRGNQFTVSAVSARGYSFCKTRSMHALKVDNQTPAALKSEMACFAAAMRSGERFCNSMSISRSFRASLGLRRTVTRYVSAKTVFGEIPNFFMSA